MDPMDPKARFGEPPAPGPVPPGARAGEDPLEEGAPTPPLYRFCDTLSETLLYLAAVFSPWAFGTTQPWAVAVVNGVGLALGTLLLAKRWVRWRTGYRPPRWGEEIPRRGQPSLFRWHTRLARNLTRVLATLTGLTVGYCLVSALNARSTFEGGLQTFYDSFLAWLPHSYAEELTWEAFWRYAALACLFWAGRDWLLGKTARESGEEELIFPPVAAPVRGLLPQRLTRLLWVLCLNGTLLGVVGILQRLDGTDRLLWLLKPRFGTPEFHFGPFSYRGNAAQYFNLLWPVSLAFWWTLFRSSQAARRAGARLGAQPHLVIFPCLLVQVASPIISASHGGAVIALGLVGVALAVLVAANWRTNPVLRVTMVAPVLAGLALVLYLGSDRFASGFWTAFVDDLGDRVSIYENARQMQVDHPLFGTGPGTFPAMYQLYRTSEKDTWAAYAHNDWLETLITFGWAGTGLVGLMLALVFVRWWAQDGIGCRWDFVAMIWLALAGCLVHARFDFPLQVPAVLVLFVLLSCIACCTARQP